MIHQYKLNGYNIVLDVFSGSVHCVDDLAYDVIEMYENSDKENIIKAMLEKYKDNPEITAEEISDCYDDVTELKDNGKLFTADKYEDLAFDFKKRNTVIKALCLHIAHTCNLNCEYCFASQGKYHGDRALMSFEVGKRAIDFLIENSGSRVNLEVDFFGGEPLMNFEVCKQLVAYARSIEKEKGKNFRFTITTNGMLLDDEKIDYINKEMSNCVLSLDGRKEVNDNIRPTPNGKGSYDIIVPKYQKLVAGRGTKDYYVRGTFTKYNLDFANDVLHISDLGFEQLSVEPVVTDPKMPYAITESDLPTIFAEYDRLEKLMEEQKLANKRKFNFFHFMIDLNQGPCAVKRLRGCGCGNEYVAVTPDGDIYPCHQFVGIEEWKMGDIFSDKIDQKIKDYFAGIHIYSKENCGNCWARFYCSGGCNANSFIYEGDVKKSHKLSCELQKKRIECAIALAAAGKDAE